MCPTSLGHLPSLQLRLETVGAVCWIRCFFAAAGNSDSRSFALLRTSSIVSLFLENIPDAPDRKSIGRLEAL